MFNIGIPATGGRADRFTIRILWMPFTIVNAIHNFVNAIHNFVNAIHKLLFFSLWLKNPSGPQKLFLFLIRRFLPDPRGAHFWPFFLPFTNYFFFYVIEKSLWSPKTIFFSSGVSYQIRAERIFALLFFKSDGNKQKLIFDTHRLKTF